MRGMTGTRWFRIAAVLIAVFVVAGCQPERPAAGRGTPVRRVLLVGDSITHGLFGTSPQVHPYVGANLMRRNVQLRIRGFPAEHPSWHFPSNPKWADTVRSEIQSYNPDMVIIQTMLFPDAGFADKRAQYLAETRAMIDAAKSRGAHVYLVKHHQAAPQRERLEQTVAEQLQAQAAQGKGVEFVPLNWWMAHCTRPFLPDGWHLSANGQRCHADAITAAVDQLRNANG